MPIALERIYWDSNPCEAVIAWLSHPATTERQAPRRGELHSQRLGQRLIGHPTDLAIIPIHHSAFHYDSVVCRMMSHYGKKDV
jgi:hypothetical protein